MNFSLAVKEELIEGAPRAACCRRAYLRGLFFDAAATKSEKIVLKLSSAAARRACGDLYRELYRDTALMDGDRLFFASGDLYRDLTSAPPRFSCRHCAANFLRGATVAFGSVTDPAKAYRLELRLADPENAPFLSRVLGTFGWTPAARTARGGAILYFRNSTVIEEYLATVGAQRAMFALVNAKLARELRNATNRTTNCETRHIGQSVAAAGKCCAAVEKIRAAARFDALPAELRATAALRVENPEASLAELASLHTPPITKSGLSHRLQKIMEFAKAL